MDASDARDARPDANAEAATPDADGGRADGDAAVAVPDADDGRGDGDAVVVTPDADDGQVDGDAAVATPDADGSFSDTPGHPVDGDGGYACTLVHDPEIFPAGTLHETSLACLCAMHFCPSTPTDARTWVMNSAATRAFVKTYEPCGLLEYRFRFGLGFNDTRWIFDLTNGALVGQLWGGDACHATCGCTTRAGVFPAASCVVTSTEPLCLRFGPQPCGDGGNDGP